ncbi:hypothetical protein E0Z06_10545 [Rheinheimera sp. D18]|uniref:FlgO family outer membrane protein n=1 Tax=Rheinheimera sp. D18 TaxID=2545632 RepID=UPI00104B08B3|nr:FlgO family outer membrane protein [Rheinheimera sp. D18]QBL09932.1 hypothetical protein E0Z06_10545 [Rheinheimera sp. D18]
MKTAFFILSALALSSCSHFGPRSAKQSNNIDPQVFADSIASERQVAAPIAFQPVRLTSKFTEGGGASQYQSITIQHYVRGLMQEMAVSMQDISEQTPVAVASFIYLDTDFNQGTLLGNQIAESFIHELHNFGIKVLDYKVTDYIRVTPQGDFVYSRNYEELGGNLPAQYAVGGTLSRHRDGVLINARMVEFSSKTVVASAQTLIPAAVINALIPSLVVLPAL